MTITTLIRWTRQADGGYVKEDNVAPELSQVRIFAIDEDYETNPHAVCPGLKLWSKDGAVELVERHIAEGSYRAWRYEIRPEGSGPDVPADPPDAGVEPSQSTVIRLCQNGRCNKGPNSTRGVLAKSRRAKYCCGYCRVDACRRRPKAEQVDKPARKRRKDAKYRTHAERQRAYYAKHRPYELPQQIKDYLESKAMRSGMAAKHVSQAA
jgi:hypothetical protein